MSSSDRLVLDACFCDTTCITKRRLKKSRALYTILFWQTFTEMSTVSYQTFIVLPRKCDSLVIRHHVSEQVATASTSRTT